MSVRVYVPATEALLADFHAAASVPTTGGLVPADDSEDQEYATLLEAADASAALARGGRRVVVVVEVRREGDSATWSQVASVHVDEEPGADPDDDLAWFATQEVPHLLADWRG